MKKEKRVIYYKNTLTDDFAGTSINQKKISEKYNYVPKNFFFGVTSWFLYHIIAKPLVFLMVKIIYHQKFVNKKLIKKSKENHILSMLITLMECLMPIHQILLEIEKTIS